MNQQLDSEKLEELYRQREAIWNERLKPMVDANLACGQITGQDLSIKLFC